MSDETVIATRAEELWKSGARELHWSSEPASLEHPWVEGWADIYVPEICQPLGLNWMCTITPGWEEDCIALPPDARLRLFCRDGWVWRRLFRPGRTPLDILPEEDSVSRPGDVAVWSTEALAEAAADWIEGISGRRFRMRFAPEEPSPIYLEAEEILRSEKTDGLRVSHRALEQLPRSDQSDDTL